MLTDEQIELFAIRAINACGCKAIKTLVPFGTEVVPMAKHMAREVEYAATAPLLERIAELERQLEEARKDAMRKAADICDALPAPPSCNVLERNLWDVATVAAADAIRAAAAIGEQMEVLG